MEERYEPHERQRARHVLDRLPFADRWIFDQFFAYEIGQQKLIRPRACQVMVEVDSGKDVIHNANKSSARSVGRSVGVRFQWRFDSRLSGREFVTCYDEFRAIWFSGGQLLGFGWRLHRLVGGGGGCCTIVGARPVAFRYAFWLVACSFLFGRSFVIIVAIQ